MPARNFFRKRRFKNFLDDYAGRFWTWVVSTALGKLSDAVKELHCSTSLPRSDTEGFTYILGSALEVPFSDQSFDLAFSNSVIEHVGNEEDQLKFAGEMLRVARKIYCQTPCRLFPVPRLPDQDGTL